MFSEITDAGLSRKIELCMELLEIADLFEPGASHFRGKVLLDLQEAITVQTKREYDNDLLTKGGAQVSRKHKLKYMYVRGFIFIILNLLNRAA